MKIKIDKLDLINLVKGVGMPDYELMDHPMISRLGRYYGGFSDDWSWDYSALRECTEEQLYEIYKLLKSN